MHRLKRVYRDNVVLIGDASGGSTQHCRQYAVQTTRVARPWDFSSACGSSTLDAWVRPFRRTNLQL